MTKEEIASLTLDFNDYVGSRHFEDELLEECVCIYCKKQTRNYVWGMIYNPLILITVKYLKAYRYDRHDSVVCNKECMDNFIYEHQTEILERILERTFNEAP
jgi:hypothetical protein